MANFYPPGFENEKKNLAIDFDGVIHNANKGWGDGTCYGDPLPGALEALKLLSQKYKIIIFTAKAKPDRPLVNGKTGAVLVFEWLKEHNVHQYVSLVTSEKPRADLYIDDNGYRFANWIDTLDFIKSYEKL
jgi:5'(3')-deoxyribonucleotidase